MTRRDFVAAASLSTVAAPGEDSPVLDNTVKAEDGFTLAPGPNVEGVAFLRQCPEVGNPQETEWPRDAAETFHQVPWIDAASVRTRWANLEPRPREFNWVTIDKVLAEVKKYNAGHTGARRTMQIRVMAGEHSPKWIEKAGVRFYDTLGGLPGRPIHVPMPYDNPGLLDHLRRLYRAVLERYGKDPVVTVYHGTWSAGPWAELFHPRAGAPLPPDYTPAKFVKGMSEQLDVLIEEFCLKGKVGELPYSGQYPPREQIDITRPLTARIVERLGRRSPFMYVQANGWGMNRDTGQSTISWHHDRDYEDVLGQVNLSFQALGSNRGGGWLPQGDWVPLVRLAQKFEIAYAEIYYADFMPLDTKHRFVEAFTQPDGAAGHDAVQGFIGFRPWLKNRNRVLYVRGGTVRQVFGSDRGVQGIARLAAEATTPARCSVALRARTKVASGNWSDWKAANRVAELPDGTSAELEATLHTDDGYFTPKLASMRPIWKNR